ncbi:MAG: FtsQ-type POTRA domain-containing protein [Clostridiales bacterium]|nr:FtsQ-type POTRA domain-containing protein [Clostridiales bacterium]
MPDKDDKKPKEDITLEEDGNYGPKDPEKKDPKEKKPEKSSREDTSSPESTPSVIEGVRRVPVEEKTELSSEPSSEEEPSEESDEPEIMPEKKPKKTSDKRTEKPERPAAAKSEKHEKEEKKPASSFGKAIRKISIKKWLLLILLLLIFILAMLFLFHKNFRVQNIQVSGNQRFSEEQILEMSGIKEGDHLYSRIGGSWKEILKLQYGKVRNRIIHSDPYIADAKVYPHYPGEVYIEVTERRKVAYVAIPDGYAIISDDSVVLEIETGDVPKGIPEIRGLPIRSAQIGKKLDLTSSEGYDICITILGAILGADANAADDNTEFDFLSHVICVRYCENMTTFIDLDIPGSDHVLSVKLGSLQTISDDMTWLRYAIISGDFADKPGTVLDMTGSKYLLR